MASRVSLTLDFSGTVQWFLGSRSSVFLFSRHVNIYTTGALLGEITGPEAVSFNLNCFRIEIKIKFLFKKQIETYGSFFIKKKDCLYKINWHKP